MNYSRKRPSVDRFRAHARQHVIPDPHPSFCGSICQGMSLRRTKTMPVRHGRSETRGRPGSNVAARFGRFCYALLIEPNQAAARRDLDGFGTARDGEFLEEMSQMRLHGAFADVELVGDLFVRLLIRQ